MFWDKLALACEGKGINPSAAAKRIHASHEEVESWRNGGHPTIEQLNKLAKFLDVEVNDLLGPTEPDLGGKGEFWNGLVKCCKEKNTDPYSLAESMGIPGVTVDIWRSGSAPGSMLASKISCQLGVRLDDLYYYGEPINASLVHELVVLRHELQNIAESLEEDHLRTLIDFADFLLDKQERDPHVSDG